jgi:cell division protein FtsB
MQTRWPLSTLALAAALVAMQGSLWLGRDNMPQVIALTGQLADQKATNRAAEQRNAQVVAGCLICAKVKRWCKSAPAPSWVW